MPIEELLAAYSGYKSADSAAASSAPAAAALPPAAAPDSQPEGEGAAAPHDSELGALWHEADADTDAGADVLSSRSQHGMQLSVINGVAQECSSGMHNAFLGVGRPCLCPMHLSSEVLFWRVFPGLQMIHALRVMSPHT